MRRPPVTYDSSETVDHTRKRKSASDARGIICHARFCCVCARWACRICAPVLRLSHPDAYRSVSSCPHSSSKRQSQEGKDERQEDVCSSQPWHNVYRPRLFFSIMFMTVARAVSVRGERTSVGDDNCLPFGWGVIRILVGLSHFIHLVTVSQIAKPTWTRKR